MTPRAPLERLSTGDPALDSIMHGGIPLQAVTVLAGEPGTGKTVLALQMLFHAARQGRKCLYFTSIAEPPTKLFRYMETFSFFDPRLLESHILFVDLGNVLREGTTRTLQRIIDQLEEHEPAIVVIDSFRAVGEVLRLDEGKGRSFVYELAIQLSSWGATSLLVGEYTSEDLREEAIFGIADGIIRVGNERQELTTVREVEVLKLRGSDYVSGQHFFEITERGWTCYPRVRAPTQEDPALVPERLPTGVAGLDAMLGGGIPRLSATLLQGGTGTGKTLLSLAFLVEGARRGEPGIFFSLEESPAQLRAFAAACGWDLGPYERDGLLLLAYTSPVELSTDRYLQQARDRVLSQGARRVVFDSLSTMGLGVASERRFKELVYALTKHLRLGGATLVMTVESAQLLGASAASAVVGTGVSFASDNILQLRYVEAAGQLERAISVLKARGVHHASGLRALSISDQGMTVSTLPFKDLRGVLTGARSEPE